MLNYTYEDYCDMECNPYKVEEVAVGDVVRDIALALHSGHLFPVFWEVTATSLTIHKGSGEPLFRTLSTKEHGDKDLLPGAVLRVVQVPKIVIVPKNDYAAVVALLTSVAVSEHCTGAAVQNLPELAKGLLERLEKGVQR